MTRIMIIGSRSGGSLSTSAARALAEQDPGLQVEIIAEEDFDLSNVEPQPHTDLAHEAERLMSRKALRPSDPRERTHPTSPRQRGGW